MFFTYGWYTTINFYGLLLLYDNIIPGDISWWQPARLWRSVSQHISARPFLRFALAKTSSGTRHPVIVTPLETPLFCRGSVQFGQQRVALNFGWDSHSFHQALRWSAAISLDRISGSFFLCETFNKRIPVCRYKKGNCNCNFPNPFFSAFSSMILIWTWFVEPLFSIRHGHGNGFRSRSLPDKQEIPARIQPPVRSHFLKQPKPASTPVFCATGIMISPEWLVYHHVLLIKKTSRDFSIETHPLSRSSHFPLVRSHEMQDFQPFPHVPSPFLPPRSDFNASERRRAGPPWPPRIRPGSWATHRCGSAAPGGFLRAFTRGNPMNIWMTGWRFLATPLKNMNVYMKVNWDDECFPKLIGK